MRVNGRTVSSKVFVRAVCCTCLQVASDFAFIPFGGGARKCVGDQFALVEAAVAIAMLLR